MAEELVRLLLMIDLGHQHSLVVIALVSHQVSNVDDPFLKTRSDPAHLAEQLKGIIIPFDE
jgi:hypothetical protein